jgi:DNA-binding NtrC family response regulator
MSKPAILVVDDDESLARTIATFLEAKGYPVTALTDGAEALEAVRRGQHPIVIADIYIDRVSGLEILQEARACNPSTAVVLMTGRGSVRTTVEADRGGAFEYLAKPFEMHRLLEVVERVEAANRPAPEPAGEEPGHFGSIVGSSPAMVEVYKQIARCARSDETVLITGETGVGKELAARAIHEHSSRAARPFVAVESGAVSGALWESEVFGSLRGAFTGADRDRPGVIETARGGTVFFDEIGEIPAEFQAKLLRFFQQHEYRPVGAGAPRTADVRVIAATNRSLEELVKQGAFRQDLFYRLNVLRIDIPPLRERRQDIPLLVRRFLEVAGATTQKRLWLEPGAAEALEGHPWPGNVRQLQNTVVRLVTLHSPGPITRREVEQLLLPAAAEEAQPSALVEMERQHILRVLEESGGNKTRAAEVLGIQRRTLYKKLARMERENTGHKE